MTDTLNTVIAKYARAGVLPAPAYLGHPATASATAVPQFTLSEMRVVVDEVHRLQALEARIRRSAGAVPGMKTDAAIRALVDDRDACARERDRERQQHLALRGEYDAACKQIVDNARQRDEAHDEIRRLRVELLRLDADARATTAERERDEARAPTTGAPQWTLGEGTPVPPGTARCPFCDGDDAIIDHDPDIHRPVWVVTCRFCAAQGPWSKISADDAVTRWNDRPEASARIIAAADGLANAIERGDRLRGPLSAYRRVRLDPTPDNG